MGRDSDYESLEKKLLEYKELLEKGNTKEVLEKLIKDIEIIKYYLKNHVIFSLLGDKKGVYMNIVSTCFNYGTFVGLFIFYIFNPFGLVTAIQSVGILDFLAKAGGFGGTFTFGTASLLWLKARIKEYKSYRKVFENSYNLYDERVYFPWEKENSKIKKFLDIFR